MKKADKRAVFINVWGDTLYDRDDLPYDNLKKDFPKSAESFKARCKKKAKIKKDLEMPDAGDLPKF